MNDRLVEVSWYNITESGEQQLPGKETYTYDAQGRKSILTHYFEAADGTMSDTDVFAYHVSRNTISIANYCSGGQLCGKAVYIYDAKSNITKWIRYSSNGRRQFTEIYRYDMRGNPTAYIYDGIASNVFFREAYAYKFDSHGNWVEQTTYDWSIKNGKSFYKPKEIIQRTVTYY